MTPDNKLMQRERIKVIVGFNNSPLLEVPTTFDQARLDNWQVSPQLYSQSSRVRTRGPCDLSFDKLGVMVSAFAEVTVWSSV